MREPVLSPSRQPRHRPSGSTCAVTLHSLFGTDLTLIPGIGESTALVLFAELGPDLSRFPTAAQFASWLNLCPHNQITGGKIISSHTGPGTCRAAQALRWATQSLYRSPSSLGQHFRRMRARQGTPAGDHCDRAQAGADHLPPDHASRGLRRQHPRRRGAPRPATLRTPAPKAGTRPRLSSSFRRPPEG